MFKRRTITKYLNRIFLFICDLRALNNSPGVCIKIKSERKEQGPRDEKGIFRTDTDVVVLITGQRRRACSHEHNHAVA